MASSLHHPFLLFVFLHAILFRSKPVHCDGIEDSLFEGINYHRQSLTLQALTQNEKAKCLAEEIVNQLEDQLPCNSSTTTDATRAITIATIVSSGPPQPILGNYPGLLKECHIDINTTRDGVILPLCVAKIVYTGLVCRRCPQSHYSEYLSSSNYTGAGINSGDSWTVIVLSTNTTTGSFSSAAANVGFTHCLLLLFLELFLFN